MESCTYIILFCFMLFPTCERKAEEQFSRNLMQEQETNLSNVSLGPTIEVGFVVMYTQCAFPAYTPQSVEQRFP